MASSPSRIRDALFPVYGYHEVTKFLLLGLLKFFIIFVLTLTRDTKDTLIVTQCGAEAIAFLKVYGVLPAAAAFIATYGKMSNVLSREPLFYATCIPFFLFFFLYDIAIYPNLSKIEPQLSTVQSLAFIGDSGSGVSAIVANILAHWTSALFFIVAEIYSSVSAGILFWKFANDVVSMSQAKRFYPMFAYMSSFAPIIAGQYVVLYASKASSFDASLRRLTVAITLSGIMICVLHHTINVFVDKNNDNTQSSSDSATAAKAENDDAPKAKKGKPKMNMTESIKFLASSTYLGLITVLVVGYGLMYNFNEISWKSLVKKQYPDALDYQRFMGNISSLAGATTFFVIFLGSNIINMFGWRAGALATPFVMSMVALPFFVCTVFLGVETDPKVLHTAVLIGTLTTLLSRGFKYGMFDPTTQMAYIPLDEESKTKGKAAIDVLGSRVGKSGASLIQQGLVFMFGNIIKAAPVVMALFYAVSFCWLSAASKLSALYLALGKEKEQKKVN